MRFKSRLWARLASLLGRWWKQMSRCWVCSALGLCGRSEREGWMPLALIIFQVQPIGFHGRLWKKRSCSSDLATQHRCPPPCHSGWRISLTRLTRGRLQARQAPSCLHGKFSRDLIRPGVLWLYAECDLERSFKMGLTSTISSISAVEWEDKYILAWNFKTPHPTLQCVHSIER